MKQASNPDQISRRRFLSNVIKLVGAGVSAAVAVPIIGYFLSPAWTKSKPLTIAIASVKDIPTGQPVYITYEQRVRDGWFLSTLSKGAWVVTKDGQKFTVFDPHCTHLSCPFYWDKDKQIFQCPCHDGRFDIEGSVVSGPPPRPLDRLEAQVQQGEIVLTGNTVRS